MAGEEILNGPVGSIDPFSEKMVKVGRAGRLNRKAQAHVAAIRDAEYDARRDAKREDARLRREREQEEQEKARKEAAEALRDNATCKQLQALETFTMSEAEWQQALGKQRFPSVGSAIRYLYEHPKYFLSVPQIARMLRTTDNKLIDYIRTHRLMRNPDMVAANVSKSIHDALYSEGHTVDKHARLLAAGAEATDDEGNVDWDARHKFLKLISDSLGITGVTSAEHKTPAPTNVAVQVNIGNAFKRIRGMSDDELHAEISNFESRTPEAQEKKKEESPDPADPEIPS